MSLIDFLLARIAEDEAVAREAAADEPADLAGVLDIWVADASDPAFVAISSARVLAECEAKRRIILEHTPEEGDYGPGCWCCNDTNYVDGARLSSGWPCETMKALALPYAAHPDWREGWRP